jgi:L-alanine-DL-glutamate epimerase-like enolase superfamily enzyme
MIVRHLPTYQEILKESFELRDGYIDIPTRPGIGFELNEEAIARLRG